MPFFAYWFSVKNSIYTIRNVNQRNIMYSTFQRTLFLENPRPTTSVLEYPFWTLTRIRTEISFHRIFPIKLQESYNSIHDTISICK